MAVRSRRSNRYGVVPSLRPPNPPPLISTSFAVKTPGCVSALSTPKPSSGFKTTARIGGPPVAVETVPRRKTDVSDAEWLQRLHEYGLLRPSFRPQAEIAGIRLPQAAGASAGLCGGAYSTPAKGADADEPPATSCRIRHHRRGRSDLDQPTPDNKHQPSLNRDVACLKVIDTFRCLGCSFGGYATLQSSQASGLTRFPPHTWTLTKQVPSRNEGMSQETSYKEE